VPVPAGLQELPVSRCLLVYLHGFASSPRSSKATFFAERAAGAGVEFVCPDLNQPEFPALTVTRMIGDTERAIGTAAGPVLLVGSSLGGFVALHTVSRRIARLGSPAPIAGLVLLAPALDLMHGLESEFGPEKMAQWRASGALPIFHYGDNTMRELGWGFMEDLGQYESDHVDPGVPTLIYQGRHDELVRADVVQRWASGRSLVTLKLVDDGHQLLQHLDAMWSDTARLAGGP
jgi:uncharacterized protein